MSLDGRIRRRDTGAMSGPLYLFRRDPARNMARFYGLDVQPTLFGDMALLRHWGRIGHPGQSRMTTYADAGAAEAARARRAGQKRRRGYAPAG
jgi:predicted DNA-binding WGR domain protein